MTAKQQHHIHPLTLKLLSIAVVTVVIGGCSLNSEQEPQATPVTLPAIIPEELRQRRVMQKREQADSAVAVSYQARPQIGVMPPNYRPPTASQDTYADVSASQIYSTLRQPLSTFSIDVDTASYANTRRYIMANQLPPEGAVRAEEMINYFNYQFQFQAQPDHDQSPFTSRYEIGKSPWNSDRQLLTVTLDTETLQTAHKPSNLVFLLDVSGSMSSPDKLPLVKRSLKMLSEQLNKEDSVAIVVYAGAAGVVLEPTAADDGAAISQALDKLNAGGSTNGGEGIEQAYALAQQAYIEGGNNRVILATDGDFNVGINDTEQLKELIQQSAKSGIQLTTLGFGRGNYNDEMMEEISNWGDGNAAYIDTLLEARKVLVEQLGSTLQTVASDVKIQMEFNPQVVSEYRLIGYQNRKLADEDFTNDKVDAGEVGAGHQVTAVYELTMVGSNQPWLPELKYAPVPQQLSYNVSEYGHLKVRYKKPGEDQSQPVNFPLSVKTDEGNSKDFIFASSVAGFAELLCCDKYLIDYDFAKSEAGARQGRGLDVHGYRADFIRLVQQAGLVNATK
ncbi:hypothetical protein SIN8267_01944 [Sinobacterium norvegicum]|uniref:VWFA domain-containing protein n=1 Tax=Sinobacterium norvegicum TaxID=1641715 RepID=A0ABN8EHG9_9GAMM|nr:VWA domain-containing protein [Sinobacterium norvegicum]CAH0991829.1 hypothetical protein SIN8267_01944 [Sinobacterium norvegicum]